MLSKIIVGVTGAVLLGVGAFVYWDHQNCPLRQGCGNCDAYPSGESRCCLQPLEEISTSESAEALTVMPREVTEQQP